jgi:hypothetical protein
MDVCVYSVFVLSCVGSGLATGRLPVQGVLPTVYNSGRQPMVREKMFVIRGEIWTLFAIFMFIILFHYIIILFQTNSNKYHTNNFVIIKQVQFILIK